MRCLSCDKALTDREATRKYTNWREMKDEAYKYIDLCDDCLSYTDLTFFEQVGHNLQGDDKDEEG